MHQQTIQRLHQKLENFGPSEQEECPSKNFAPKQKEVLERLRIFKNKNEKNYTLFIEDLERAEDTLRSLERSGSKSNNLQAQLFENLERWVSQQTNQNTERNKALRRGILESIDRKYKTLKVDAIEIIQTQFQETCKNNLDVLEGKLEEVTTLLQQERAEKQEIAAQLGQQFGGQILKLQNLILQEKQDRKNQNLALFDLLDEISNKAEASINEEIRDREKFESYIENKLEQVCYLIQSKILGGS